MFFKVLGLATDPIFSPFCFSQFFSLFVARSMRVIRPPSFTARFLILVLCAMTPWLVCLLFFSLGLRICPPPFTARFLILALCVMIPWLVCLLIFLWVYGFVVRTWGFVRCFFCFPIRSIKESSVFHTPVWSCYPLRPPVLSIFMNSLSIVKSVQLDLVRHFFLVSQSRKCFSLFSDAFVGNMFVVQDIQADLVWHLNLSLLLSVSA
jgi:hypothetical protein